MEFDEDDEADRKPHVYKQDQYAVGMVALKLFEAWPASIPFDWVVTDLSEELDAKPKKIANILHDLHALGAIHIRGKFSRSQDRRQVVMTVLGRSWWKRELIDQPPLPGDWID